MLGLKLIVGASGGKSSYWNNDIIMKFYCNAIETAKFQRLWKTQYVYV